MICVSLANMNFKECLKAIEKEHFVEIRLDKMSFNKEQVSKIFSQPVKLIATCRPGKYSSSKRMELLKKAIDVGANYVDLEIEGTADYLMELTDYAHNSKTKVIYSYHNFDETPDIEELIKITRMCFDHGADLAKVVTMVKSNVDRARILSLYGLFKNIVAFGMGDKGKLTRILAPLMGAEFTYACREQGNEVAPGQIDKASLLEKIELLRDI